MSTFSERVYECVCRIPHGRIINYGGVAALVGQPRAAQGVGQALSQLPYGSDVPWWRVINSRGGISTPRVTGQAQRQRALLEHEGVRFDDKEQASFEEFGWFGEE